MLERREQYTLGQAVTKRQAKTFPFDYQPLVANGGMLGSQMHTDGAVIRGQFRDNGDVNREVNSSDREDVQLHLGGS